MKSSCLTECLSARGSLGIALLACVSAACHSDAVAGKTGRGTVVIAVPAAVTTVFPYNTSSATDEMVTGLLYDRLADIGPRLNTVGDRGFIPVLAQRWTWSIDSLSITFGLRPAARWHDGRPVRAADVKFSIDLARNPSLKTDAAQRLELIDGVHVDDTLTATVHFRSRAPDQFYALVSQVPIVPSHLLAGRTASELARDPSTGRGIGSGRFQLATWLPGERLELRADTLNYRGRPGLDRVILSTAPDFGSAAAQFHSGAADIFEHLSPPMAQKVSAATSQRIVVAPDQSIVFLAFNLRDPRNTLRPHPIFGDRAVRRALSMAVDRTAMLHNVYPGGAGASLEGPVPSTSPFAVTSEGIRFSPIESRRILDGAGWRLAGDGVRARGPQRLAFSITIPNSSAARRQYAILLQQSFRLVGADVRIRLMDFPAFVDQERRRSFDAELATRVVEPGVNALRTAWTIGARAHQRIRAALLDAEVERAADDVRRLREHNDALRAADEEKTQLLATLTAQADVLSRLSTEDGLTGAFNRRHLDARLEAEWQRSIRFGHPLAFALLDVDHFKSLNDQYSHAVGDEVLRSIAAFLRTHTRQVDLVARYGGEEFGMMFVATALDDAALACESLRVSIARIDWSTIAPAATVTVSIGVAAASEVESVSALMALADRRLYTAKRGGRDQVRSA